MGLLPTIDVSNRAIGYEIRRERWMLEPYFTVKNVLDNLYIAFRAPQGIQPGLFQQVQGGPKIGF